MDNAALFHAREQAMIDFAEGRIVETLARFETLLASDPPLTAVQEGDCRLQRSTVYACANRWKEALADLEATEKLSYPPPRILQRMRLSEIYHAKLKLYTNPEADTANPKAAEDALAKLRAMSPVPWLAEELESDLALKAHDWERCIRFSSTALQMFEREGWLRPVAIMRRRLAEARMELHQFDQAEQDLTAAHGFFAKFGSFDDLAYTSLTWARLKSRSGAHDEAWRLALQALERVESLIRNFRVIGEQQQFLVDKLRFYDEAFEMGMAAGGRAGVLRGWTIAERAKSFYLCHLVANADVSLFDGIDAASIERLQGLETRLDGLSRTLMVCPPAEREETERQQREISEERQKLLFQIMKDNPRWAAVKRPVQADISEVLRELPRGWTAISYYWRQREADAELYIFSVPADGEPRCTSVPWSKEEIDAFDDCHRQFTGNYGPANSWVLQNFRAKLLPDEVLKGLPADLGLLISPHARLRGIPIHALDLGKEYYLIQRQPVQYVPTLGMVMLSRHGSKADRTLLMGCPETPFNPAVLRSVEEEIGMLNDLWRRCLPDKVDHCIIPPGGSPTEAGFPLSKWREYGILHFSCHGDFPAGRPFDAALLLGSDAVRGSELFGVSLRASLVILSACNLGKQNSPVARPSSDEWVGIYLPMFYAGAGQLLVSLWEADAATAQTIMVSTHSAIAGGSPIAQALRQALSDTADSSLEQLWANWYLVGIPESNMQEDEKWLAN
jgi:CHAT domain-containing protein